MKSVVKWLFSEQIDTDQELHIFYLKANANRTIIIKLKNIKNKIKLNKSISMVEQVNNDSETGPFFICGLTLECGHECKGVAGESSCLPCLKTECIEASQAQVSDRSQESDEMNQSNITPMN